MIPGGLLFGNFICFHVDAGFFSLASRQFIRERREAVGKFSGTRFQQLKAEPCCLKRSRPGITGRLQIGLKFNERGRSVTFQCIDQDHQGIGEPVKAAHLNNLSIGECKQSLT